jgi:hypothetical protein
MRARKLPRKEGDRRREGEKEKDSKRDPKSEKEWQGKRFKERKRKEYPRIRREMKVVIVTMKAKPMHGTFQNDSH